MGGWDLKETLAVQTKKRKRIQICAENRQTGSDKTFKVQEWYRLWTKANSMKVTGNQTGFLKDD